MWNNYGATFLKVVKKRLPPQKWPLPSKFLQYIHVTPIIGSEILSGLKIILQNFGEWKMCQNVDLKKLSGRIKLA
jgi:hypothetical protein